MNNDLSNFIEDTNNIKDSFESGTFVPVMTKGPNTIPYNLKGKYTRIGNVLCFVVKGERPDIPIISTPWNKDDSLREGEN